MNSIDTDFSFSSLFSPLTDKKAVLILSVIGFLVYFNMLFNGFVWDDLTYIIGNQELVGFKITNLVGQNMFNSSGYYRPIPAIYFSLLYNLFGQSSFFYHFFQLVLHIGSASLLFYIFKHFFTPKTALLLGLLFLIHPVNVESVSYIGSTQSQLYFLFGGTALYLGFKDKLKISRSVVIHIFLALALFTKEVSILYFFLVYLYRLLFKKPLSRSFILLTGLTISLYLVVRLTVLDTFLHRMEMIPISEISLFNRLLHIPAVFFYYLKNFFYPHVLAINQIWTISELNLNTFYLPLILSLTFLVGLLLVGNKLFYKHRKAFTQYIFFLLWFLVGMGFLLQIFPLDMTVADRWFYFPIVGLLGLFGIIFSNLIPIQNRFSKTGLTVVLIIISALSVRTMVRNTDWIDALTLYSRDANKYENYDLQNNLGAELAFSGDFSSALPHFLESVRLLPHDTNLYNAGTSYERLGDYPQAIEYYRRAVEVETDFPKHDQVTRLATEGLGKLLLLHDQPDKATTFLRLAVKKYPDSGSLWAYLAISEYNLKNYESALSAVDNSRQLLKNPTVEKLYKLILERKQIDLSLE